MTRSLRLMELYSDLKKISGLDLFESENDLDRFSKDCYNYSPLLKEQLEGCRAEIVVRPNSLEAILEVAALCKRYCIYLTLRGSGTGNYGQCVPLLGGVVMLMNGLRKIRHFDSQTGVVTVEAGCLLRDLDRYLLNYGRQLRLSPSTWRSASVGGFLAGGSGGIGSVRWGFLRDPGHLEGLEIVTLNDVPRILQLNSSSAESLNHAYGTNGIITALSLTTTTSIAWQEVIINCKDWLIAVNLLRRCSASAIDLNLCTLLEQSIVEKLPKWFCEKNDEHRLLFLVAPDGVSTLNRLTKEVGASFFLLGPEDDKSGKSLRELSWNHTTLHMRSVDPTWTYLQMLLPDPEIDAMTSLKQRWGEDWLWHLEVVRQQGQQRLAALPVVRWRSSGQLEEMISDCKQVGAILFNPHVFTVEDGGLGVVDADQVKAKYEYDPLGILNPGKLKGWDLN